MAVRRVDPAALEPGGIGRMTLDRVGWRMAVRHRTGYRYAGPVRSSYNEARLTPSTVDGQRLRSAELVITPPARPQRYVDYWGTTVDAFDIHVPHGELVVVAHSTVDTSGARGLPTPGGWPGQAPDRFGEFLSGSRYVTIEPELVELGRSLRAAGSPLDAGHWAAAWTHGALRYERGATHVRTSSAQARRAGRGVCQDFAHLALALLRATGLPARYVSGYLHPDADAEIGVATLGESHAWVEFWAGDWVPLDPTTLVDVAERHVVVARGRDYADVRPLSGVYSGPAAEQLGVTVELTRLG